MAIIRQYRRPEFWRNEKISLTLQRNSVRRMMPGAAKGARGVIGSRARLRIWCLTTWGFESLRAHSITPDFPQPSGKFRGAETVYRLFSASGLGNMQFFR